MGQKAWQESMVNPYQLCQPNLNARFLTNAANDNRNCGVNPRFANELVEHHSLAQSHTQLGRKETIEISTSGKPASRTVSSSPRTVSR